jgi:hypothetical protein
MLSRGCRWAICRSLPRFRDIRNVLCSCEQHTAMRIACQILFYFPRISPIYQRVMKLFASLILISIFSGCAAPQASMRTGTVARDGHTILWNEPVQSPAPNAGQFVDTLLRAGSAYCTGYANTAAEQQCYQPYQYRSYEAPPGLRTMTVWQYGVPTTINY